MRKHAYEQVESEIRKEKAEALGRTGERLERTLLEIGEIRRAIHALAGLVPHAAGMDDDRTAAEMEGKLAEHARLCEAARQLRLSLIIQREAVGLWRHEDVDRTYPPPPPLTRSMLCRPGEDR
jgi:hypothetical protein